VLTSPTTYSSGLILASTLHKLEARVIGLAAGQRVNHFGEVLNFTLPHTNIDGRVSCTFYVYSPDDVPGPDALAVDVRLTFDQWKRYGFDRHATVLLARDFFRTP